ncbi:MAG: outer membrane beta-barrel protein [Luteibacter sp.]
MIKYFIAAMTTIAVAAPALAYADGQGAFVQAGAGQASQNHTGTSWSLSGGYRWAVASGLYVGLEGGYHDLANGKFRYSANESFTDIDGPHRLNSQSVAHLGTKAVTFGVAARWDFADKVYATAHGGIARYRYRQRTEGTSTIDDQPPQDSHFAYSLFDTRWYAGAGMGYDFTPQLSLQFTYDHYPQHYSVYGYRFSNNLDIYSTALEFRF